MVNERYDDKYEGHEEGEYHFSDDQANYELENDASTAKDGTVVAAMPKESMAEKLKNHRRIVIGIVIFIVLLGIVYKLIMPSSNAPVTDFSQQGTQASTSTTTTKMTTTKVTTAAPAQSPAQFSPPQTATQPPAQATPPATTQAMQPAMPQQAMPQQAMPQQAMPQQAMPTQAAAQQAPMQQAVPQQAPEQTAAMPQQQTVTTTTTDNKSALDRIAALEQQNSAMMSMMQTQYAQKIADTEAQNTELRNQVQELTSRVSSMEVAFKQLTKILRNANAAANTEASQPRPMRVSQPKLAYTVQAIIPGRAWLKSDTGETVTVAEGDVIRGIGRITKIDPYDGIVNIDTGNKVVTLSYGASGD